MIEFTKTPRTEIVRSMPFDEYRKAPGINQTLLKCHDLDMGGVPALYRYLSLHPDALPETEAMKDGQMLHQFILEPSRFDENYVIMDGAHHEALFQRAKAEGQEAKLKAAYMNYPDYATYHADTGARGFANTSTVKAWEKEQEAAGKCFVPDGKYTWLKTIADRLKGDRDIFTELDAINPEDCEFTCFAPYKTKSGDWMQFKARLDWINRERNCLLDLKSCVSANPDKFARDAAKYGYDIQAAWYLDVAEKAGVVGIDRFGFVAVEKEPPFLVALHWMPDDWLQFARLRYKKILADIAENMRRGWWPSYGAGQLMPPNYLLTEIEAVTQ